MMGDDGLTAPLIEGSIALRHRKSGKPAPENRSPARRIFANRTRIGQDDVIGKKCLRIKSMKHGMIFFSMVAAAAILAMPVSGKAAGKQVQAKFSFDGL